MRIVSSWDRALRRGARGVVFALLAGASASCDRDAPLVAGSDAGAEGSAALASDSAASAAVSAAALPAASSADTSPAAAVGRELVRFTKGRTHRVGEALAVTRTQVETGSIRLWRGQSLVASSLHNSTSKWRSRSKVLAIEEKDGGRATKLEITYDERSIVGTQVRDDRGGTRKVNEALPPGRSYVVSLANGAVSIEAVERKPLTPTERKIVEMDHEYMAKGPKAALGSFLAERAIPLGSAVELPAAVVGTLVLGDYGREVRPTNGSIVVGAVRREAGKELATAEIRVAWSSKPIAELPFLVVDWTASGNVTIETEGASIVEARWKGEGKVRTDEASRQSELDCVGELAFETTASSR